MDAPEIPCRFYVMFSKLKNLLKKPPPPTGTSSESVKQSTSSEPKTQKEDPGKKGEGKGAHLSGKPRIERTKQGIPVIDPDEDLGKLFGVDDSKKDFSGGGEKKSSPPLPVKPRKRTKKSRVDKHGFPILDSREDLEAALLSRDRDLPPHPEKSKGPPEPSQAGPQAKPKEDTATNKHGIRILTDDDLPFDLNEKEDREPEFEDLLYKSLGNKSMDVLIHEKKQAEKKRKKPTVKQLLKAYPAPQGQLDLHGYTALKAELRVESYLKNAFHNQTHTVNIIVGKGLHSQEGAVLPDVVEVKLNGLKKEGTVLAFEWDKKKKSRSGSVIVYLNNWPYA